MGNVGVLGFLVLGFVEFRNRALAPTDLSPPSVGSKIRHLFQRIDQEVEVELEVDPARRASSLEELARETGPSKINDPSAMGSRQQSPTR